MRRVDDEVEEKKRVNRGMYRTLVVPVRVKYKKEDTKSTIEITINIAGLVAGRCQPVDSAKKKKDRERQLCYFIFGDRKNLE